MTRKRLSKLERRMKRINVPSVTAPAGEEPVSDSKPAIRQFVKRCVFGNSIGNPITVSDRNTYDAGFTLRLRPRIETPSDAAVTFMDIAGLFTFTNGQLVDSSRGSSYFSYDSAFTGTERLLFCCDMIDVGRDHGYLDTKIETAFVTGRLNIQRGQKISVHVRDVCMFDQNSNNSSNIKDVFTMDVPFVFSIGRVSSGLFQLGGKKDEQQEFIITVSQYFDGELLNSDVR